MFLPNNGTDLCRRMLEEIGDPLTKSEPSLFPFYQPATTPSSLDALLKLSLPDPEALVSWTTTNPNINSTKKILDSQLPIMIYLSTKSWWSITSPYSYIPILKTVNHYLRNSTTQEGQDGLRDYLFHLFSSFYQLPPAKGETGYRVYRGPSTEIERYVPGRTVIWKGLSSCTLNRSLAHNLLNEKEEEIDQQQKQGESVGEEVVLFEVHLEDAGKVEGLLGLIEDPLGEVLITPSSEFYVLSLNVLQLPPSPSNPCPKPLTFKLIQLKQLPFNIKLLSPSSSFPKTPSPTPTKSLWTTTNNVNNNAATSNPNNNRRSGINSSKSPVENINQLKLVLEKGTSTDQWEGVHDFLSEYYNRSISLPEDTALIELVVSKLDDHAFIQACPAFLLLLELLGSDPLTKAKLNKLRLWFRVQRLLPDLHHSSSASLSSALSVYACRLVAVLAAASESVQQHLLKDGAWTDIKNLLMIFPSDPFIQQNGWAAAAHLAASQMGAETILKEGWALLKATLLFHSRDAHVAISAIQATAQLSLHPSTRALISQEMLEPLKELMVRFETEPSVQEASARTILNLAMEPALRDRLMILFEPLLRGMERHLGLPGLQAAGCGAIGHLSLEQKNKKEAVLNGWPAIKRAMLKSGCRRDATLLWRGCSAIAYICWEHPPSLATLFAGGAWEAVKHALESVPLNPQVTTWGSCAIYSLASCPRMATIMAKDGAVNAMRDRLRSLGERPAVKKWITHGLSRFEALGLDGDDEAHVV